MVITHYGASAFKVSSGDFVIAFDPPSKKSTFRAPHFKADIVLISHDDPDHNGYESLSSDKNPAFIVRGPGEYEVKEVMIKGIQSFHDNENGKKLGLNTIYTLSLEDMRVCHLGDLGEKDLRPETKEAIGKVDILFLPVGGKDVIGPDEAIKIANQIEASIIIPMHYETKDLKSFLKEAGSADKKPEEKLTVKKKDLSGQAAEIIPLKTA